MAEMTWEKLPTTEKSKFAPGIKTEKLKFVVGGILLLVAVLYLVLSGMDGGTQYFMTIDELVANSDYDGQIVRISGAVIGETIDYDTLTLDLNFTVAHIPKETTNLALTLHEAVLNPTAQRLEIRMVNQVMPDLLQNEAQAILSGKLGEDGIFYASELLLKCPSRYEETVPMQAN
jgi:cytochrome c-type biogenesis protein CcmE